MAVRPARGLGPMGVSSCPPSDECFGPLRLPSLFPGGKRDSKGGSRSLHGAASRALGLPEAERERGPAWATAALGEVEEEDLEEEEGGEEQRRRERSQPARVSACRRWGPVRPPRLLGAPRLWPPGSPVALTWPRPRPRTCPSPAHSEPRVVSVPCCCLACFSSRSIFSLSCSHRPAAPSHELMAVGFLL